MRKLANNSKSPDGEERIPKDANSPESGKNGLEEHHLWLVPKLGTIAKGVGMGVAVSVATKTGKQIAASLVKNPAVLFGLGFVSGFLLRKYRKRIIATANVSAEHSKQFAMRQKENLKHLLHEND